jgi:hypothetical protein
MLEARPFNVEIRLDDLELAPERGEFPFRSQHAAKQRRQPQQGFECTGRRRLNEVPDGRQRVEQEVRVDLRAQGAQLRFRCELPISCSRIPRLYRSFVMRMASIRRATTTAIDSRVARSSDSNRRPPLN